MLNRHQSRLRGDLKVIQFHRSIHGRANPIQSIYLKRKMQIWRNGKLLQAIQQESQAMHNLWIYPQDWIKNREKKLYAISPQIPKPITFHTKPDIKHLYSSPKAGYLKKSLNGSHSGHGTNSKFDKE